MPINSIQWWVVTGYKQLNCMIRISKLYFYSLPKYIFVRNTAVDEMENGKVGEEKRGREEEMEKERVGDCSYLKLYRLS